MTSTGPPPAALSSLLTVIITTSPTPSAPSTDLLSSVLLSFRQHCPGLVCCRVIVVFDTYDRIEAKARLKRGTVTAEGARNFALYRDNVKELILREYQPERDPDQALTQDDGVAEYGLSGDWNNVSLKISHTHDKWVTFIEPTQRLGFGLAVRSALRLTSTPYVWIHQHDWTLISDIPLQAMLQVMQASSAEAASEAAPPPPPPPPPPVKYICLPSVRMASYAVSPHVTYFPELRRLTASLRRDFFASGTTIPLTPLFFWHDKPHVASVGHYLERVFPSRLAMPRGAFIEDTVGHRARGQMKGGVWARWACWLYYPDEGRRLCLRHLNGRMWRSAEYNLQKRLLQEAKGKEGGVGVDGVDEADEAEEADEG